MEVVSASADAIERQLQLYLEIYRHHFDTYLKAVGLYLATVGALTAYLFRTETSYAAKVILAVFLTLLSVGAVVGSVLSRQWVFKVQTIHHDLASRIGLPLFPFSGATHSVALITCLCGLVALASLAYLVVAI